MFPKKKFDYRFHYDANQTNRMFVRTSYFSLSLRSTEETIPHTPNMQQENSVRKRAKTRKRRRKRYSMERQLEKRMVNVCCAPVSILFLFMYYIDVRLNVGPLLCLLLNNGHTSISFWLLKQAVRRPLPFCVCVCVHALVLLPFTNVSVRQQRERDVNVERAFVFVLCMRQLTAMPHNTIKNIHNHSLVPGIRSTSC